MCVYVSVCIRARTHTHKHSSGGEKQTILKSSTIRSQLNSLKHESYLKVSPSPFCGGGAEVSTSFHTSSLFNRILPSSLPSFLPYKGSRHPPSPSPSPRPGSSLGRQRGHISDPAAWAPSTHTCPEWNPVFTHAWTRLMEAGAAQQC